MANSLPFSVASVIEDVFQQHGNVNEKVRSTRMDLESRKAHEAALRRNEAATWLRKMVGVDLPVEPSIEEFRLGLRSGHILCNVLNQIQPGLVPKVVETPHDPALVSDGAALSAYQYFENVRNCIVAMQQMGLPTFDVSDLEQGGTSARVVNSVLALKSYYEWKQGGGNGVWKFNGNVKTSFSNKPFVRKASEPFTNSVSWSNSNIEKTGDLNLTLNKMSNSNPFGILAREVLKDKAPEEVPMVVESLLSKVVEEINNRLNGGIQTVTVVETPHDPALVSDGAALSAYQYFENVRNCIVAMQQMGLPTFDVSDLEQGGTSARVVNSVLALKSYYEWKQGGGNGVWKFNGNVKTSFSNKPFVRKASEPFTNSVSWSNSNIEKTGDLNLTLNKMSNSNPFGILAREVLKDKAPEEVPMVVESLLSKVVEEINNRLNGGIQTVTRNSCLQDRSPFETKKSVSKALFTDSKAEDKEFSGDTDHNDEEESGTIFLKSQHIVDKQHKHILDLKSTLQATKSGMQFLQMKYTEEFQNLGLHIRNLSNAAAGYHKVLEENRKLYNQVQDLKGSIRVYCRIRPFLGSQKTALSSVEHIDGGDITINTLAKNGKGRKSFHFNKVFGPNASQDDVFADTKSLIRSALDGYNVCIFAYGQTGSGKTYTMTGPSVLTEQNQGVNYRALHDLFLLAEQRKDMFHYDISVQMMEIYNEQVRDLLVMDGSNNNKRLDIRNSSLTGFNVPDANLVPVKSTSDVINLMTLGHKNRAVGSTALNDRSSRSHSCLTVHVHGRELTTETVLRGCMHLVDLAGSERVDKSEVTGDRLKEAQHINRSLSALGDVIASLAQKNPHVPYRNSKLTQLLQDSLGGQAKTLMFVHISPELDAVSETISTLKFAERVSSVDLGAAKVNKDNSEVKELKEQIASLKAALLKKEGEQSDQTHSLSASSSAEKIRNIESSPYCPKKPASDLQSHRQPMCEVGNIEAWSTPTVLMQKKLQLEIEEPVVTSAPRPPANLPCDDRMYEENKGADGEWVDKVMVNKLGDASEVGNTPGRLEESSSPFRQKYLQDTSNIYHQQSYNLLMGNKTVDSTKTAVSEDDDTASSSDSSGKDLCSQHNHVTKIPRILSSAVGSKIPIITSVVGSKLATPTPTKTKGSKLRIPSARKNQSPTEKLILSSATPIRIRKQLLSDGKPKVGSRK